jgi:hypothetical protein
MRAVGILVAQMRMRFNASAPMPPSWYWKSRGAEIPSVGAVYVVNRSGDAYIIPETSSQRSWL